MSNLSSPTRDQTHIPSVGSMESYFMACQEGPRVAFKEKKKKGKEYMNKRGRGEERKMSKAEVAVEVKLWDGSRETE